MNFWSEASPKSANGVPLNLHEKFYKVILELKRYFIVNFRLTREVFLMAG